MIQQSTTQVGLALVLALLAGAPASTPASAQDNAPPQLTAIEQSLKALQNQVATLGSRIDDLEAKLKQAGDSSAARTAAVARLHAAGIALESGQKLGEIPDAPAALAKFANTAPPTLAGLRLTFNVAATAAQAASTPDNAAFSPIDRMWQRVQSLVTVRHGNQVVVGTPAAVSLSSARLRLDSGDLAGAVDALAALDDPAKAAMAAWLGEAQALLDARAALAVLVAKS